MMYLIRFKNTYEFYAVVKIYYISCIKDGKIYFFEEKTIVTIYCENLMKSLVYCTLFGSGGRDRSHLLSTLPCFIS